MSSRHGLQNAALGGLALLLLASEAVGQSTKGSDQPAAQATQTPTKAWAAATEQPPKAAPEYKPECWKPRDKEEMTLCADIRATKAAERASELAGEQVLIGWFQAGGLLVSLAFTGWAAWAAAAAAKAAKASVEDARKDAGEQSRRFDAQLKVATDAANATLSLATAASEANALTRELFVEENRPIITLTLYSVHSAKIMEDGGLQIGIVVRYKNIGKSAAKETSCHLSGHTFYNGVNFGVKLKEFMTRILKKERNVWPLKETILPEHEGGFIPTVGITKGDIENYAFGNKFMMGCPGAIFYIFDKGPIYFFGFLLEVRYNGPIDDLSKPGELNVKMFNVVLDRISQIRN